ESRQRADRIIRMQCTQYEVASLGRPKGEFGRRGIADLTDHDHVWVMTQEGPEVGGECIADPIVDLVLTEAVTDVLDGVLGGQNLDTRLIDGFQSAEERGALAAPGGASDQNEARRVSEELAESRRDGLSETQIID